MKKIAIGLAVLLAIAVHSDAALAFLGAGARGGFAHTPGFTAGANRWGGSFEHTPGHTTATGRYGGTASGSEGNWSATGVREITARD